MALLDTTFLIDLMKETKSKRRGHATRKLAELIERGDSLRVAVFTIAELEVGVVKCSQPVRERHAIETCMEPFEVVGFSVSTARIFGSIVGRLELEGQPISDMDGLIASVALEMGEPVVTRNPKHFDRVPGLRVETYG